MTHLIILLTILTSWQFGMEQSPGEMPRKWKEVTIPHDWAISTTFDRLNDLQEVAVAENGESKATWKTGRSGGLKWMGTAWYKTCLNIRKLEDGKDFYYLLIDGAMSHSEIYVNGKKAAEWPYGYNSYHCDITQFLHMGKGNEIAIRLENQPESSRWYPGAGLYRNIHLIHKSGAHIPVWEPFFTTSDVSETSATIELHPIRIVHGPFERVYTKINYGNLTVGTIEGTSGTVKIAHPRLWSPETPNLYRAVTCVEHNGHITDSVVTTIGIRSIRFTETGFLLNGEPRKFRGVCLHHDLGPLGSAVHADAMRHQLTMLKDMGCDAIRTTHNMPAPELVTMCEEMGFMLIIESFDEWTRHKCKNGYADHFDEWAEKDITNMVKHYRNSPSVVMWSIGNEVVEQTEENGYTVVQKLQDICHRLDSTRPVTCGMDKVVNVVANRFAETVDIPGFNYRTGRYILAHSILTGKPILGSETASTVSSRGAYHFPVEIRPGVMHEDLQSSSYDVEYCSWSGLPDQDFQLQDDYPWTIGQFVWTGFDYLGEPTPYDTDAWPSHSSYFGIIDLASLPKDRYYLYRSQWNKQSPTLHILPHWTWPGKEGEIIPVYVYTSYPEAELFVNGKSQGKLRFAGAEEAQMIRDGQDIQGVSKMPKVGDFTVSPSGTAPRPELLTRYRLMWHDVAYEAGELRVVAYHSDGTVAETTTVQTAGKPDHLEIGFANKNEQREEGLCYLTVSVVDKDGHLCPNADCEIKLKTKRKAFVGTANGDPACLDAFTQPHMHAFHGKCTFIVKEGAKAKFKAKGLKKAAIRL